MRAPRHLSAHHPSEDQEPSGSRAGGSWPGDLQRLLRDAEQLATDGGCEGTERGDDVVRQGGRGIPAPCRLTRRPPALIADRCWPPQGEWLPSAGRSPSSRPSGTDCCPFAARRHDPDAVSAGVGAFCLVKLTRPPKVRGFALCLPLTEREPLSLRGSRVVEHDRMRVGGRQRGLGAACGQVGRGC